MFVNQSQVYLVHKLIFVLQREVFKHFVGQCNGSNVRPAHLSVCMHFLGEHTPHSVRSVHHII